MFGTAGVGGNRKVVEACGWVRADMTRAGLITSWGRSAKRPKKEPTETDGGNAKSNSKKKVKLEAGLDMHSGS